MEVLKANPIVYVIENRYEIFVLTHKNGIVSVKIGKKEYFENCSGVLYSMRNYHKISVPQSALNKAKKYTVCFRETINKTPYYPEIGDTAYYDFEFKPIEKTENINLFHIADVHYKFDDGIKVGSFFGNDIDLFVFNGDLGEVNTVSQLEEVVVFVGKLSMGKIPVLFSRGNHDTRGTLAELYGSYFPVVNEKTYFYFSVGPLAGAVLDCGEDKVDVCPGYGKYNDKRPNGVNIFERYRREEYKFIKKLKPKADKIYFIVSHICPVQTAKVPGDEFDIERPLYTKWNKEIERLSPKFMLCGHRHDSYILEENSPLSSLNHNYKVIVGSKFTYEVNGYCEGCAIILSKDKTQVKFTDKEGKINQEITF